MLTPIPPDPHGAGAIPVLLDAQIKGMRAQHEVALVTVAGPDPAEWEAVDRLQRSGLEVHAVRRGNPTGIDRWKRRWRFGSTWLLKPYPWRTVWFFEPGVQEIVDDLLGEGRFDLVHVEDNGAAAYRLPAGIPSVLTEHEVRRSRPVDLGGWKESGLARWALAETDWRRWRRYHPDVWQRFDRIQVFTHRDEALVCEALPHIADRMVVNPFPVAVPPEPMNDPDPANTLLFIGNYTHPPNVDAAVWLGREIMPALRARAPGVRLTLVGGHAPDTVRDLACDDITVTGFVPEVEPYIAAAAVMLAPIRIGGGMRMKVLQAMSFGKPVVTTSRGADGLEIDGFQPPLVVADDTERFVTATANLLSSAGERRQLGNDAYAFIATHHSPEAYVRRLENVYAQMLVKGDAG